MTLPKLTFEVLGGVLLFLWVTVLGLIFSDLWAGVRKAKKAGIYRTSDGYKKTIDKMARYYNMMLQLTIMDGAIQKDGVHDRDDEHDRDIVR